MSLALKVDIKDEKVLRAFKKFPSAMISNVSRGLHRGALEISREARKEAPKAFSNLTNSITVKKQSDIRYLVGSGLNYAGAVEQGAESGGSPSHDAMLSWIKTKGISPNDSEMSEEDLAYVMARSIARKGTPKQPYLEPALKAKESRVIKLVREGAAKGLREVGL